MDFDSLIQTSRLPEKPWRADALIRLVAGIAISMFGGTIWATTTVRYFSEPHHTAMIRFLCFATGALVCLVGAVCMLVREWPFEKLLRKLLTLLLCIYVGSFLLWLAMRLVDDKNEIKNPTIDMLVGILAFQGMAVVLVHFFLRDHHIGWAEGFGFNLDTKHAFFVGTIVGICALPATWGLEYVSSYWLQWLTTHHLTTQLPQEQEAVKILRSTEGWQNRLVLGVATIIIAPIAEEILFRGILYPSIKRMGHPKFAWWFTALLFAAVHLNLATFVPLAFLAFLLIWLYEYTGNLLACIVTHGLFNAANFIALYLTGN